MISEFGIALSKPGAIATGLSVKLISVPNYDGMPFTAENIFRQIMPKVQKTGVSIPGQYC